MRMLAFRGKLLKGSFCCSEKQYLSLRERIISQQPGFQHFRAGPMTSVNYWQFFSVFMSAYSTVLLRVKFGEECTCLVSRNNYPKEFYEFTEFTGEDGVHREWSNSIACIFLQSNWLYLHIFPLIFSPFLSGRTHSLFLLLVQNGSVHIPNVGKTLHSTSNIDHPKRSVVKNVFI